RLRPPARARRPMPRKRTIAPRPSRSTPSASASRPGAPNCGRTSVNRQRPARNRRVHAMNPRSLSKAFAAALFATMLAACSTMPAPSVSRDGARAAPGAGQAGTAAGPVSAEALAEGDAGLPQAQIRRGTGRTINNAVAASPPPNLGGTTGETTFNFEGESLQAVVKAILGDMLGQNYVIAPGVQGTVTYVTSRPVSPAEALSLLEMVLGWNNARMIYSDGRYNIVPADTAMATGAVAPRTGPPVNAR